VAADEYFVVDICTDTRYGILVTKRFRRRGLERLFQQDDPSKVRADQARRITDILGHLDRAERPYDLDLPGYRLHALKGDMKGAWSATISGSWRITFRFVDGNAVDVDLVDYH